MHEKPTVAVTDNLQAILVATPKISVYIAVDKSNCSVVPTSRKALNEFSAMVHYLSDDRVSKKTFSPLQLSISQEGPGCPMKDIGGIL